MNTVRNRLSARKVAEATTPGYHLDGGCLYLRIHLRGSVRPRGTRERPTDNVTKCWCFRYRDRATGRKVEYGLGSYLDVSLADAREKAAELRRMLIDGHDPLLQRQQKRTEQKIAAATVLTFDEAAERCIADMKAGWRNAKHAHQWTSTLATYASPVLGKLPVSAIDLPLIRKVLDPIWTTKNETASRVRQRIESVLAWATVSGYRSGDNPARWRGNLDHILPRPGKVQAQEHHPALPYTEIGDFVAALRRQNGVAALALEFLILTAARTNEVIKARWEEFDLEKALWTVPAERMKAHKEHTVPLSPRARDRIRQLAQAKLGPYVFLFPAEAKRPPKEAVRTPSPRPPGTPARPN